MCDDTLALKELVHQLISERLAIANYLAYNFREVYMRPRGGHSDGKSTGKLAVFLGG